MISFAFVLLWTLRTVSFTPGLPVSVFIPALMVRALTPIITAPKPLQRPTVIYTEPRERRAGLRPTNHPVYRLHVG